MRAQQQERQKVNGRFMVLRLVIVAAGLVLAARVVQLQIFMHAEYEARAEGQWGKEVALNAERGNLYDRDGRPLALSVTTWQIGVAKKLVKDEAALCEVLASVLDQSAAQVRRKLRGNQRSHVVLARDVVLTVEQEAYLKSHGQQAITFEDNHARIYPADGVGASLIGFYRKDPRQDVSTGCEYSLNNYLSGTPGRAREIQTGLSSRKLGKVVLEAPVHGQSLVLTLDTDLQTICEDRLGQAVRDCGAVGGSVLILDPRTGDILAAASWPLMDTRARSHPDPREWQNRNFTTIFEPGSVFKVFSAASLLHNSAVDTQTVFDCDNNSGEKIYVRNDAGHDYGDLNLMQAFAKSSNVYFAKASANLRPEELYRDLTSYGFGQGTTLEYPSQPRGLLAPPAEWSGRSQQTIAIGQEVAVTSLQLGLALCSVANGGTLYAPRLVKEIRSARGEVIQEVPPVAMRRVMAPPLAAVLREAMGRVIREGTGRAARLDWIDAGGKTGTAQKSLDGKTFTAGKYVASFGGMVPLADPRLVILTVIDEPSGSYHYAAASAAPLFRSVVCDIRRSTAWLTDVPGPRTAPFTQPDPGTLVKVPDVIYLAVSNAVERLAQQGLLVAGGEKQGQVVQQVPAAGTRCRPGTVVTLTVADRAAATATATAGLCPDFTGLSNRQVRGLAARLRIPVVVEGVGYAVRQTVRAGNALGCDAVTVVMQGSGF